MNLVGSRAQRGTYPLYDASGVITTGNTAQLVLPVRLSTSSLILQNLSSGSLYVDIGAARATATITSGVLTSVAITNAGFGFTRPPLVEFLGGGNDGNSSNLGLNQPTGMSPSNPATGRCVLTGTAVTSIEIDNPGSGYVIAPYCFIYNDPLDPYGVVIPSSSSGFVMPSGAGPIAWNGTTCPTEAVSIIGATTSQPFLCKWME